MEENGMFNTNRSRLAFASIALAALVLVAASPAKAADECKGKVVGFPVRVEGAESGLTQTATATYGARITVRVDVTPCPKAQPAPAAQGQGSPGQAPPASPGVKPPEPSSEQKKDQSSEDGDSWIPGLRHSDLLKLVPYLNARPLKGIYPESIDPHNHLLTFHLARTDGSKEAWTDLLSNPGFDPRVLTFSVGLEDKEQLQTSATLSLIVIRKQWLILAIALFLIVLYIFFRLAARTSLLRDGGGTGVLSGFSVLWTRSPKDPNLPPFSLARTQMSFWFFLVIGAFVLIWLVIGDTDTVTAGVLVLIGISAGTALGATAIDSSKSDPNAAQPAAASISRGFLNDILSDTTTGISFHRFQIAVWTIVLGFIFVRHVLNHLVMPDFSTNLLTLMGISSGTYLGMKLPEKASPTPNNPGGG
jgi:hypothetical protein